ncbi:MAG: hypothetical protein NDF54_10685 [archaeon GB-1867-035]|nr:hypothetical protein [Candidatus Culexmicrobium profundum]
MNRKLRVLYSPNMEKLGVSGFILNSRSINESFIVVSFSNYTFRGKIIGETVQYVINNYQECFVIEAILKVGRSYFGPSYLYDKDTGYLVYTDGIVVDPSLYYMDNIFFIIVKEMNLVYINVDLGPEVHPLRIFRNKWMLLAIILTVIIILLLIFKLSKSKCSTIKEDFKYFHKSLSQNSEVS